MAAERSSEKFRPGQTFLIGFAFFTTFSWSLYNTQVNQQVQLYIPLLTIVGIIMAIDNIIGVILQPIMGNVSDNTRSKYGRRMPYIVVGVIFSAIFFALIPTGFGTELWILLIWIFCFSISMAFYRSQAVALMPDFVRPIHRSKGNAIINIMGGIGTIFAFTLSLVSDYIGLQLTFIIASIVMIIAMIILFVTIKEKDSYSYKLLMEQDAKEAESVKKQKEKLTILVSIKDVVVREKDKSTFLMLLAIFAWFVGYNGLEALFTIYAGPEGLAIVATKGLAGFLLNAIAITFIISAFPLSLLAKKIGRRLCIKIGLIIMIIALILAFLFRTLTVTVMGFILFGIGWALVNVNSIVIIWELAPNLKKIGTYTGLYYFFSVLAAILGPMLIGMMTDLFGLETLLLNGAIFLIIAFVLTLFVRRGEVEFTEEEKLAREKTIAEL
jgi:maltose/moltooligosaccharide transporter